MIATRLKNFTPILDSMTKELGLVTSAVYGVVWRYCQLKDGMCFASVETMAEKIGVKRRSVERHLSTLCKAEYLHKIENPGRPNIYQIAGTPVLNQEIVIEGATESRTPCDRESHEDTIEDIRERESNDSQKQDAPEESSVPDTPPDPPQKRARSERDTLKSVLTAYFSEATGVPPPPKKNAKQCKAAAHLWWNPLCAIANICDDDLDRTKKLIDWTVAHLDQQGFTISHPLSIKNTAVGEQARRQRSNGKPRPNRKDGTSVRGFEAYSNGYETGGFCTDLGESYLDRKERGGLSSSQTQESP